jgi:hypothetical protein
MINYTKSQPGYKMTKAMVDVFGKLTISPYITVPRSNHANDIAVLLGQQEK